MEQGSLTRVVSLPKRTRSNVQQSKNGCFTCRRRRLKCDETKPLCLRCTQSGRRCEGYHSVTDLDVTNSQYTDHSLLSSRKSRDRDSTGLIALAIPHGLPNGRRMSSDQARSFQTGLQVLLQEYSVVLPAQPQPTWVSILTHLSGQHEATSNAIILFGSAYEDLYLRKEDSKTSILICKHRALIALQRALQQSSTELLPVFVACIILAAFEALQRNFVVAALHLRGAYKILIQCSISRTTHVQIPLAQLEALSSFAKELDLQTAWFALSDPPYLPPSIESADFSAEIEQKTLSLLHSCYHVACRASPFKYRRHSEIAQSIILEQSRYLAALHEWLVMSDTVHLHNCTTSCETLCHASRSLQALHVLKIQVLSTLIYLSSVLSPLETAYDSHTTHFLQIIQLSEDAIVASPNTHSRISSGPHFQLRPGIIQPLFLTAMKYRDPFHRRRVVRLLEQLGIEGPWNAKLVSRLVQRAIEIEEQEAIDQGFGSLSQQQQPLIPESRRLHGCALDSEAVQAGQVTRINAQFSLCKDIDEMIRTDSYKDPSSWILWTEVLEVQL